MEGMGKVSAWLAGGVALLAAVFGVAGSTGGGVTRVLLNSGKAFWAAFGLVVGGVVLAAASSALGATFGTGLDKRFWLGLSLASLGLLAGGIGWFLSLSAHAADRLDRPRLDASLESGAVRFTARAELLRATDFLSVTVYGYPLGWDRVKGYTQGEDRGSELLSSRSGPSATGVAEVSGAVVLPAQHSYQLVEVRAYTNGQDRGCVTEDPAPKKTGPTACADLYIQPTPPKLSAP